MFHRFAPNEEKRNFIHAVAGNRENCKAEKMNWLCMEEKCRQKDHGQCRNADTDRPQQYSGKRDFFMVKKHVKEIRTRKIGYDQITQCIRVQADTEADSDRSKVCSFPVFRYKSSTRTEQEMQHNIRLQSRA